MAGGMIFERREKKYLLDGTAKARLLALAGNRLTEDAYPRETIASLYLDTPDRRVIRASIDASNYKEKLRLRSYGIPQDDSPVFVEIKKKYNGVVNKRRIEMQYAKAVEFLAGKFVPDQHPQIEKEIEWVLRFYTPVPKCIVAYDRIAYVCDEHPDLRVTFDESIRCRDTELDLRLGTHGELLLPDGECIMEIKADGAIPLWFVRKLSEMKIYKTSFSKYGTYYLRKLKERESEEK